MVGSRYAPAAEKRPLLSLKRRETQSQHAVTNRRGPRTTPVQRLRTAATKKRRSAAIALHIFRCDEKCGLRSSLARRSPVYVGYYSLKDRVEREAVASAAGSPTRSEATFLELAVSPRSGAGECILEWEDAGGGKMRVHLKGVEVPDLVALSRSFWEGRR